MIVRTFDVHGAELAFNCAALALVERAPPLSMPDGTPLWGVSLEFIGKPGERLIAFASEDERERVYAEIVAGMRDSSATRRAARWAETLAAQPKEVRESVGVLLDLLEAQGFG